MHPRKRLDISWSALGAALLRCVTPQGDDTREALERWWSPGQGFAALSVRTTFDLWLSTLDVKPGDQIVLSAVTIPHMVDLIRTHGLEPVPLELDPHTLDISPEGLERALGPRVRGVLLAHLLGARLDLDAAAALCAAHEVPLIEDCAQAWVADGWRGHPGAALSMFSFGTIKSCTALGGAMTTVRDAALLAAMRDAEARYPVQPPADYARKIARCALLLGMGDRTRYGAFIALCELIGQDHDLLLRAWSKGFSGPDWLEKLRMRPCAALLATLHTRLVDPSARGRIMARAAAGEALLARAGGARVLGSRSPQRTHWLLCVEADAPQALIARLRAAGFDATTGASTLIAPDDARCAAIHAVMSRIVYVPVGPPMPAAEGLRLAALLDQGD